MITKKYKRISLLVVVSMLFSLLPVNIFTVEASSVTSPILNEEVEYSEFFDELTTFINEKVSSNSSKDALSSYLKDANFEKAIAQRELLKKAGASTIKEFANTDEKKNFINWLFNSTEAMNLFLEGGEPDTEYSKAFNVWFEIWSKDPDSHNGYELRLAIAAAMKFGNGVPKWYTKRTLVTAYERYEYYKVREAEGVFPVSMKTRSVWELRNTIKAPCSNWDLDYVREVIHKDRYNKEKQKVAVRYPPYTSTSIYKDENGNPYSVFSSKGDQFFGPDATIKEVHEIGGVCGTASKFGTITNNAFGIPGFNVGQPGHAAHVYHSPNSDGKWDLGYNISGWGKSKNRQSTYVPYTNYDDVSNRPVYWLTYEKSREDEEALHKSHQLKWIADALTDYNKAQAVRKFAIEINRWNIDVWKDYINAIKNFWNEGIENAKIPSKNITIEERDELVYFILNTLKDQPRPAYDLLRSIQDLILNKETSREKHQKYILDLNSMLEEASEINKKQSQITQEIKNLMPSQGFGLGDFNFNGANGGKLVGSKTDTEYSLDGGKTFKPITEENMKLTPEEIESITPENGIKLRLKGTSEYISIIIKKSRSLPKIYSNDDMNEIFGLNDKVYFSTDDGETWTRYRNQDRLPDLSGDLKLMVKIPADGKTVRSEIRTFNFTNKVNPSIVLTSDIESIKTSVFKSTDVKSIYDGNINSVFHTNFSENGQKMPQSVTLELKEPSDIYKLEYVPKQDTKSHGDITEYKIYASSDGENFTLVSKGNWLANSEVKTALFNARAAKYIRFEGVKAGRNYMAASELRIFKNESLIPHISFSFDGFNAGKLVGANTYMEYSINNGKTWKDITEANMKLTSKDFANINPESIIKVRFTNTTEASEISFAACTRFPNIEGDDTENTITGLDNTMEYSIDGGETWTSYNGALNLGLRGNVNLYVRYKATGTTFAGEYKVLNYTAEEEKEFDERVIYKFISKATGRSIEIRGASRSDNADVIQSRATGWSRQVVYLVPISHGQYKIVSKLTSKVLVPKNLSTEDGATLAQTTYTGSDIEKWKIVSLGNNEYEIINAATGLAMTANSNRSTINISKLVHSNNQVWSLNYLQDVVVPEVTFSFDGENAGKIVGSNKSMEYTLDGGQSWKSVSRDNITLSKEELSRIKSEYGIKIRVKGNAGILAIKTNNKANAPEVKANDNKNIIEGINSSMEYSVNSGNTWVRYKEDNPAKFLSDVNVLVRTGGNGVTPPGESIKLSFTSKITTPLYKEFDPMKYIAVKDSEGNDISDNIEITENNVDVNKKGMFSVTYKIPDGDDEKTITREVEVVSDFKYLSDINYKRGNCGWRRIVKDTNINGNKIVLDSIYGKDIFQKGIIAHANSEIVYDVENKGYTNFQSYIGIENDVYTRNSSVIFKVYVDGILKYDSGVMGSKAPHKYVDIDIKGAKEIKLVADSNGNNSYDHATWADAKFVKKDSAPVIEATNVAYEKDDVIDFNEILKKVKATDIEDGDLSSKVTYTTDYTKGSTGNFDIVYSVVDREGYKTEKTVKLIVVNSSIYVSDTDWLSARCGWSSTKKDVTISRNPLRIWDGEKVVTYEKGIGTHAYSETIYDLTGKNYGYFTSYVGASREGNSRTSVEFKVYVDGELKAETGIMKKDTAQEFIKVNIGGAKQLKLVVTDGGDGKGNDSAIWGDAKFLIADKIVMSLDTSILSQAIEEAESLKEEDYEKDSWEVLEEKLSKAKSLLTKEEVDQSQVDKALEDIKNAISSLEKYIGQSPVINAEDVTFYKGDIINFHDILAKVIASDEEDGNISLKITYITNYVENQIGEFQIVYNVTDSHGNKTIKKVKLIVEEKFVYASDIDWTKGYTTWGKVQRNKSTTGAAISLWDGTKEVVYEKGIGTHAYSEVIYNLEGRDFKYFTSVIGVNRSANYKGSVDFKVFVDDKLAYTSEIMKKNTPSKTIKVNIEGAKNIKLVVEDGGNGRGNDHANWVDAKFIKKRT